MPDFYRFCNDHDLRRYVTPYCRTQILAACFKRTITHKGVVERNLP